ncbi:methionyl-tRNA formyltransferase [Janibacter melonis]|uniref:Methionyl-tRNA formyltransferase n=1 Tax=Janibacter melonis TaxID=262209 RepID=A0A5P8FKF1_9MICO|nr:methionyl-tRNA formyltransferase [Janibacter melonis]QFQ30049.2 methionyl-tRNA formyltransferase [Janibacter melonis]
MRVIFAGTPDVAVPSLRLLLDSPHEVVAVLTRPDARSGRGRTLTPSPVRVVAQEAGVPVLAPRSLRDEGVAEQLAALEADVVAVVAYGALVPAALLAVPTHGWVNLHLSLLPAWRGAAPVQRAIMAGDEVSGATTFVIEEGLDTGPVLGTMTEQVRPDDTSGSLLARLGGAGAPLLLASLEGLVSGEITPQPQGADGVSHAPKLTVEEAEVRWTDPGFAVDRHVRGCTPDPGAWTTFRGDRLRVGPLDRSADRLPDPRPQLVPGELAVGKSWVLVGTADGPVLLGEVTPVGKRPMAAADWARGARVQAGERLADG